MSYIIDQKEQLPQRHGASSALKGFFGFALLAIVVVNVVVGAAGIAISELLQFAVGILGGIVGVLFSLYLGRATTHQR